VASPAKHSNDNACFALIVEASRVLPVHDHLNQSRSFMCEGAFERRSQILRPFHADAKYVCRLGQLSEIWIKTRFVPSPMRAATFISWVRLCETYPL
jgi:hypothetical protein